MPGIGQRRGDLVLAALALRWPDTAPRAALRALLERHAGNLTAAAHEIGAQQRALRGALALIPPAPGEPGGEVAWWAARWPHLALGGLPAEVKWQTYRVTSASGTELLIPAERAARGKARWAARAAASDDPGVEYAIYAGRGDPPVWSSAPVLRYVAAAGHPAALVRAKKST